MRCGVDELKFIKNILFLIFIISNISYARECKVFSDGTYTGQSEGLPVEIVWRGGVMSCQFIDEPNYNIEQVRKEIEAKERKMLEDMERERQLSKESHENLAKQESSKQINDFESINKECLNLGFKKDTLDYYDCLLEIKNQYD